MLSKARKFVIMVLLDTVLRAVPILVNTIRFGAANSLNPPGSNLFALSFLRIFSQLPANGSSRNNCSIEKLINFADGVIFNRLICTTLRFFHLLQEAFFRSTTKFSLPISKSFHKNV